MLCLINAGDVLYCLQLANPRGTPCAYNNTVRTREESHRRRCERQETRVKY